MAIATNSYQVGLEEDDAQSFGSEVVDFVQYGITGAIASGAVGIANTAISFSNIFSDEKTQKLDTEDLLLSAGWEHTAAYYDDHRDSLDALGFVASSLIPGTVGLKALKAVQKGLTASGSTSRAVIGLRRVLVPENQAAKLAKDIAQDTFTVNTGKRFLIDASKQGFHQAAVETAFAEAAILALNNQNPSITSQDMSYFEAIRDNLSGAGFGFVFGTGIGGVINTAIGKGILKTQFEEAVKAEQKLTDITGLGTSNIRSSLEQGDQISVLYDKRNQLLANVNAAETGALDISKSAYTQITRSLNKVEIDMRNNISNLAKDAEGQQELTDAVWSATRDLSTEDAADLFASSYRIGRYDDSDVLWNPTASPLTVAPDEDSFYTALQRRTYGKAFNPNSVAQRQAIRQRYSDTKGTSFVDANGDVTDVLVSNKIIDGDDKEASMIVMRHEFGHFLTNKVSDRVTDILTNTTAGKELQSQLEQVSDLVRGVGVRARARNVITDLEKTIADGGLDMEQVVAMQGDITAARNYLNYINNPKELLADAVAAFNTESLAARADALGPQVKQLLQNNQALKNQLGLSESYVDLRTGAMYDLTDRSPTVADLGEVKLTNFGAKVEHGRGTTKIDSKFNVLDSNPVDASAHYFHAYRSTKKLPKNIEVDWTNIPRMQQAVYQAQTQEWRGFITITNPDGNTTKLTIASDADANILKSVVREHKRNAIQELRNNNPNSLTDAEIARLVDVDDTFANASGLNGGEAFWSELYDVRKPTVAKMFYKNEAELINRQNNQSLAEVHMRISAAQTATDAEVNNFLQGIDKTLVDMLPASAHETGINSFKNATTATQLNGLVSATQGNYTDSISFAQQVGAATKRIIETGVQKMKNTVEGPGLRLKNNPEALAELAVMDTKLRQRFYMFADNFDLQNYLPAGDATKALSNIERLTASAAGKKLLQQLGKPNALMTRELDDAVQSLIAGKKYTQSAEDRIDALLETDIFAIQNDDVVDFWRSMNAANQLVVRGKRTIASVRGLQTNLDDRVLYPGKLDRERYRHIKFVVPNQRGIFAYDNTMIIGGPTPQALAAKEEQVLQAFGREKITIKDTTDEVFNISEFTANDELLRRGIQADIAPDPSPQLVDSYINSLTSQWNGISRNMVEAKYAEEIGVLESRDSLVQHYSSVLGAKVSDTVGNSYRELRNTMLHVSSKENFRKWRDAQQDIDAVISRVANSIWTATSAGKTTADFDVLNKYMKQHNVPLAFNNQVGEYLVQTEKVNENLLTYAVPRANAAASTFMLRFMEGIQPMVNALSVPIMAVPEIKHLIESLPQLKVAQAASGLANKVPGSDVPAVMPNNARLMYQAVKDFFNNKELVADYKRLGLTTSIADEMRNAIDDLGQSIGGLQNSTISKFQQKFDKVVNTLSKPADWTEEFVKFTAARMADLLLESAGVTNLGIRQTAMRTYVTRVHGNYVANQRPALFQGFAGQAVGLFQTYTFNLFQQLLRHVGTGQFKAAGSMIGLQAGIFGAQSVPGFKYLNQYIGERSLEGNDFYTGTEDVLGNEVSDWILYGVGSNFTKPFFGDGINIYTRGDLNPRTPFIIPTSIEEIPTYSLATKFIDSGLKLAAAVSGNVDATQSMAEALAINGINRPLAGIGQILSGARTTREGSLLAATGDLNYWQTFARVLGTKTLDESIAVQGYYRAKGYQTYRRQQLNQLGTQVKTMVRGGEWNANTYDGFFKRYTQNGGSADQYQKWLQRQASAATQSNIYEMYQSNSSLEGQYLQRILGTDASAFIDVTYD